MRKPQGDNEARPDELGNDSGQVGPNSAGQSGDPQGLSPVEDDSEESVEELADAAQALEAATFVFIECDADHRERSVHTHIEHPRPEDVPPKRGPD